MEIILKTASAHISENPRAVFFGFIFGFLLYHLIMAIINYFSPRERLRRWLERMPTEQYYALVKRLDEIEKREKDGASRKE